MVYIVYDKRNKKVMVPYADEHWEVVALRKAKECQGYNYTLLANHPIAKIAAAIECNVPISRLRVNENNTIQYLELNDTWEDVQFPRDEYFIIAYAIFKHRKSTALKISSKVISYNIKYFGKNLSYIKKRIDRLMIELAK